MAAIPVLSGRVTEAELDAAFWAVYRIADRILPKARCRCCGEAAGRSPAKAASE